MLVVIGDDDMEVNKDVSLSDLKDKTIIKIVRDGFKDKAEIKTPLRKKTRIRGRKRGV